MRNNLKKTESPVISILVEKGINTSKTLNQYLIENYEKSSK